ncbi:MAG: hypothetical protein EBX57_10930, partial [Betaproteobacteria bacterium]|nr:hypothetical protein [Betaproteobacteria bacterium]
MAVVACAVVNTAFVIKNILWNPIDRNHGGELEFGGFFNVINIALERRNPIGDLSIGRCVKDRCHHQSIGQAKGTLAGDIGNRLFDKLRAQSPRQFMNCGVAEANMMGVAAGMGLCGLRPIVYTI